jgi:membrane-bound lytic murein transglycosylase MltF
MRYFRGVCFCLIYLIICNSLLWAEDINLWGAFNSFFVNNKGEPGHNLILEGYVVHTRWQDGFGRKIIHQNKYNNHIEDAAQHWDKVDPLILKSILAQESSFRSYSKNRHGYVGIAQLGVKEAVSVGLKVGSRFDQRLDPQRAIIACVKVMEKKAVYLEKTVFKKYGQPQGDEYWKFIAAAYNAGEGTIAKAMRIAYKNKIPVCVRFDDLIISQSGLAADSALYKAIPYHWGKRRKFREIRNYASSVVLRARQ